MATLWASPRTSFWILNWFLPSLPSSNFVPFSHSCGSMERSWKVSCCRWELQRVFSLATSNFQQEDQGCFVLCAAKLVNLSHQSTWLYLSTSLYSSSLRFACHVVPFRFTTTSFICPLETRSRSSQPQFCILRKYSGECWYYRLNVWNSLRKDIYTPPWLHLDS